MSGLCRHGAEPTDCPHCEIERWYTDGMRQKRKPTTAERIEQEYDRLKTLSLAKNMAYGDSALNPVNIFSRLPAAEAIRARLDDKLARHRNAPGALGENEIDDLIGYLVLLNIAEREP